MNVIWTLLMCVAVCVLGITQPQNLLPQLISSASSALELTFSFAAVYCVWLGFFNVLSVCGVAEWLAKRLSPVLDKVYGKIDPEAKKYILLNMTSNLIGISNAATPSAVKAIEIMEKNSNGKACFATVMLFVLNATSLQILPTTVMGMRAAFGSTNSADIILPTLISSAAGTVFGVLLVSLFVRGKK